MGAGMCYDRGKGMRHIKDGFVRIIATGGYIGYCPIAPGTCGSILGVGVFLLLLPLPQVVYGGVFIGAFALGVWAASEAEQLLGKKDASAIVIDELVGMLVTYFTVPVTMLSLLAGFVLFRLFDVVKPVPQLERLPGGWGVMLDDLCAGILAHAGLRLVLLLV
jgi:phosphatidylglycerophosphatase A